MTENLIQLISQYGILGLLGYVGIKDFFAYIGKKNGNGGGKKDNTQDIEIAVLKEQMLMVLTNHIPHIEKSFESNTGEHKQIQEMLIKIMTKLDIN